MSKFVLYGTPGIDGPHVLEVTDADADTFAAGVGGTVHDTADAALSEWDRPEPTTDPVDAPAPAGDAPTPAPVGDPLDAPTAPSTQAPSESSPTADQS